MANIIDMPLSRIDPTAATADARRRDAQPLHDAILVVDGTGVGRPVVDLFREADLPCRIIAVMITAGSAPVAVDTAGYYHVPKRDLAGVLQTAMQSRRLAVAKSLPHAETLAEEMKNFKVKVTTAANEKFEAWREKDTDDLVLAAALCVWAGEREQLYDGEESIPAVGYVSPRFTGRGFQ